MHYDIHLSRKCGTIRRPFRWRHGIRGFGIASGLAEQESRWLIPKSHWVSTPGPIAKASTGAISDACHILFCEGVQLPLNFACTPKNNALHAKPFFLPVAETRHWPGQKTERHRANGLHMADKAGHRPHLKASDKPNKALDTTNFANPSKHCNESFASFNKESGVHPPKCGTLNHVTPRANGKRHPKGQIEHG
jgi:hypothetical protein